MTQENLTKNPVPRSIEESLQLYKLLAQHSRDIMLFIRFQDSRIIEANEAAQASYGYRREELLGMPLHDLRAFPSHNLTRNQMALANAEGGILFETEHRRRDGSTFPVEVSSRGVDIGGERVLLSIIRDITERRKLEDAMWASERRFRQTLENVQLLALELDPEGQILFCNNYLLQLTDWERDEVIGQDWFSQFLPENFRETVRVIHQNYLQGTSTPNYENPIMTRQGELRQIRWNNTAVHSSDGRVTSIISLGEDVTKQQQAEEALRQSEQRYRSLFSEMGEGFALHELIYDDEGKPCDYRFLEVNPAFEKLTGMRRDDVVGRTFRQVLPGESLRWLDTYAQVVATGETVQIEEFSPALQRYFHAYSFRTVPGQFAVLFFDITARKQMEWETQLAVQFLRLINVSADLPTLLRSAVKFIQQQTHCEAVGIRLRKGVDYPYYETRGFSEDFLLKENSLCVPDAGTGGSQDQPPNPVLECMCGNVIQGRFDPAQPFFTAEGSFWTNCTTELLAQTAEADRQARTRNRCNGEGYESVALIPLRTHKENIGLLQLNDRKKGRFTLAQIHLWERLSAYLAIAISRAQAEEETRQRMRHNQILLDSFPCVAMLLRPQTRQIVALNQTARKAGATLGQTCFGSWARSGEPCPFCRAPKLWAQGQDQHLIVETQGVVWDAHWVMVSDDLYLHYAFDITDQKRAEEKVLEYQRHLRHLVNELVLTEERQRRLIADDLHERIGQGLALGIIKMQNLAESHPELAPPVNEVRDLLQNSVESTRTLMYDLSSPTLARYGPEAAVEEWLEEYLRGRHHLEFEFSKTGTAGQLSENLTLLLFRAIKEILHNVIKHAWASRVMVCFSQQPEHIRIEIRDDGKGFNACELDFLKPGKEGGFGLFSIQERLNLMGGKMTVESAPGQGTTVTLIVPLR